MQTNEDKDMIDCMKAHIEELKRYSESKKGECENLSIQYGEKCKQYDELQAKVRFLEGQIEAYQYCMNCKR